MNGDKKARLCSETIHETNFALLQNWRSVAQSNHAPLIETSYNQKVPGLVNKTGDAEIPFQCFDGVLENGSAMARSVIMLQYHLFASLVPL